ncbi:hypothetical protein ACFPRL_27245 [Pseudoclavibacter helvolus]
MTERRATAAEKRKQALELRRQGLQFDDIAKKVGYASKAAAHKAVQIAIRDITRESAEELIELELTRLDDLFAGFYEKARKGDLFAVDRALKVMDQRAKFLGLYERKPEDDNIAKAGAALIAMVEAARVVSSANDGTLPEAGPVDS